jgi:hypothetical protein
MKHRLIWKHTVAGVSAYYHSNCAELLYGTGLSAWLVAWDVSMIEEGTRCAHCRRVLRNRKVQMLVV